MTYVIGMDGGGTKTRLAAFDSEMKVLWEGEGPGSNLTSGSLEQVGEDLAALLSAFFSDSGLSPGDCAGVCLGSAGAGRETARAALRSILERFFPAEKILVTDDAETALAGAAEDGCGILLVAGTGSVCRAKNRQGDTCRVGGWGHLIGDEGSGYDMGRRILQAVMRHLDGRDGPTLLTELVMARWDLGDADGVIDAVYRSGKGKSDIAALAPLCDEAMARGDRKAGELMDECASALAELAAAAAPLFGGGENIPCVCAGSFLEKSRYLKDTLAEQLRERCPNVHLAVPLHDAAYGAGWMAWQGPGRKE